MRADAEDRPRALALRPERPHLPAVAEACVAWELARAAREKFGGDALEDLLAAHRAYLGRIDWSPR